MAEWSSSLPTIIKLSDRGTTVSEFESEEPMNNRLSPSVNMSAWVVEI